MARRPRPPSATGGAQGGAALVYVLTVLAIFGALVALVLRYTRFNDRLVSGERWDAQARLLARAGLDYALARLDPPGPARDFAFVTDGVDYRLEDPGLDFRVTVGGRGLWGRAVSTGRTRLPGPGRSATLHARLGQELDLARLPALGLLNREGNLVLAGGAQVSGPVMLWRGGVRKATDYHVRFRGGPGHAGPLWDSTAPAWERALPDLRRATAWVAAQEALLAGGAGWDGDPDWDSGAVEFLDHGDSARLADTAMAGQVIRAARRIEVGSGAVLVDCKLLAPEIAIGEGAVLEDVLAFASRNLEVTGGTLEGGQFAARDTLAIDLAEPLTGWPLFYVHGRMARPGRPDSAYLGCLRIVRATGEGLFLSPAAGRPADDQAVRLHLGAAAAVEGLLWCGGYAQVDGRLKGSLLCHNLKFEHGGTIWLGHLKDARLESFSASRAVPAPPLFPGFPLFARTGGRP